MRTAKESKEGSRGWQPGKVQRAPGEGREGCRCSRAQRRAVAGSMAGAAGKIPKTRSKRIKEATGAGGPRGSLLRPHLGTRRSTGLHSVLAAAVPVPEAANPQGNAGRPLHSDAPRLRLAAKRRGSESLAQRHFFKGGGHFSLQRSPWEKVSATQGISEVKMDKNQRDAEAPGPGPQVQAPSEPMVLWVPGPSTGMHSRTG